MCPSCEDGLSIPVLTIPDHRTVGSVELLSKGEEGKHRRAWLKAVAGENEFLFCVPEGSDKIPAVDKCVHPNKIGFFASKGLCSLCVWQYLIQHRMLRKCLKNLCWPNGSWGGAEIIGFSKIHIPESLPLAPFGILDFS